MTPSSGPPRRRRTDRGWLIFWIWDFDVLAAACFFTGGFLWPQIHRDPLPLVFFAMGGLLHLVARLYAAELRRQKRALGLPISIERLMETTKEEPRQPWSPPPQAW